MPLPASCILPKLTLGYVSVVVKRFWLWRALMFSLRSIASNVYSDERKSAGRTTKGRPMDARLGYAFKRTLRTLEAALTSENDYIFMFAFVIVLLSFGAMQVVFQHEAVPMTATVISALATAAIFFLSVVGFLTLVSTMIMFSYSFTIGSKSAKILSSGRSRAWRLILSFVVTGVVTAAVFNLFCDGIKELSLLRPQYALLGLE